MVQDNFPQAYNHVLRWEGGEVNDPDDPGGHTKYGISKARFPNVDISNLTKAGAMDLYREHYWNNFNLDEIKNPTVATAAMDTVVHHGYGPNLIQKAANAAGAHLKVDGGIGPLTIAALNNVNPQTFINKLHHERRGYMIRWIEKDPVREKYRRGFMNRVNDFFNIPGAGAVAGGTATVFIAAGIGYLLYRAVS